MCVGSLYFDPAHGMPPATTHHLYEARVQGRFYKRPSINRGRRREIFMLKERMTFESLPYLSNPFLPDWWLHCPRGDGEVPEIRGRALALGAEKIKP